jgi:uncharacterized protein YbaR (Trm112 family)
MVKDLHTLLVEVGIPPLPPLSPPPFLDKKSCYLWNGRQIANHGGVHRQTQVMSGKLVCGNCGHEYNIHQGIANFLLPNHLGARFLPPLSFPRGERVENGAEVS